MHDRVKMRECDKLYCGDYNISRSEEVALGRAALEVVKQMSGRATSRELLEIGCAIDRYIEGVDDFSKNEQVKLDAIESFLGLLPVWVDPEHIWVRRYGSIEATPVEWGWAGSMDG